MRNIVTIEDPWEVYVADMPGFKVSDYDNSTAEERCCAFKSHLEALGWDFSDGMVVESMASYAARISRLAALPGSDVK